MLVDWPAEPFVLALHADPARTASAPAAAPAGTPVVLGTAASGGRPEWVAERFRIAHARLRHLPTGLYLTAEGTGTGAAVVLRPLLPDGGTDSAYWRQAWRAHVQRDTGRLLALNDLSNRVLGLAAGAPAGVAAALVLETTTGAQDARCTAWAPTTTDAQPAPAPAPGSGAAQLAPGTGRVRLATRLYETRSREIEGIHEPYFRQLADRTLAAGTVLSAFAFDERSRPDWYDRGSEAGLVTYTESSQSEAGAVRKSFHRLPGEPPWRYVDGDEVDVNYVEPKPVARTNFPATLWEPYGGDRGVLLRTANRLNNGHTFYTQPEREEGLYFPRVDGGGVVDTWNKTWLGDNDTKRKVFLSFDGGRSFIDAQDITWVAG